MRGCFTVVRNTWFDGGLNKGKIRSYIMLYRVVGHFGGSLQFV